MDLVLFGIQGSGKGTLGKLISDRYGFTVFETGGELRKLAAEDSDLGRKIKSILEAGQLVTKEVVMEIIADFMKKLPSGNKILFDGIPRSLEQAISFEEMMSQNGRSFLGILIDVPREEAYRRLTTRRMCKSCKAIYPSNYDKNSCEKCGGELYTRTDDNPEAIKARIDTFFAETTPVIEKLQKEGKIITMDGSKDIQTCRDIIFKIIDENFKD